MPERRTFSTHGTPDGDDVHDTCVGIVNVVHMVTGGWKHQPSEARNPLGGVPTTCSWSFCKQPKSSSQFVCEEIA